MADAAVLVSVAVVDGLDTASARGIIFRCSDLHLAIVCERSNGLHEALSIASCSHDDSSVVVLDRSGHDFRRRCRTRTDQYDDRKLGVDRLRGGVILMM